MLETSSLLDYLCSLSFCNLQHPDYDITAFKHLSKADEGNSRDSNSLPLLTITSLLTAIYYFTVELSLLTSSV